ncbi:MAG: hypothetical protein R3A52_18480 [Polyangiales bacterium]
MPDAARAGWQEVVDITSAELPLASTRESRASLQHEVAEFEERVKGDEPAAARGYLAAFNARPAFRPPLDALIRLYTRRRSTANLAKLFDALVKAAPSSRERADAHALRGELLEDRLGDPEGALASYESAVSTDPTHRVAWVDLERVAVRSGDTALRLRALAHLAELSQDPARKGRLLRELAGEQAAVGTPEALDEAARCLRDAAALPGARWQTLRELERFSERARRPDDLVLALEGQAALATERAQGGPLAADLAGAWELETPEGARAVAAGLWARSARLRLAALGDVEGSRAAMEQCLALTPDSARAHYLAMTLADQAGDIANAGAHADWLLAGEFGDTTLRAAMRFRQAERAALEGDLAGASAALQQALELDPESAVARAALIEQRLATGDGAAVVTEFDALADAAASPRERAALLRSAAVLSLALQGSADEAVRRFRLAAQVDPTDITSRRAALLFLGRVMPGDAAAATARIVAIDDLLPAAADEVERSALLIDRLHAERWGLRDARAAAVTAEQLVEASGEARWAMEAAALHWAAAGSPNIAARWAEALAERDDHEAGEADRRAWRVAAARWSLAAGDEDRARALALEAHAGDANDAYASALALRLAWSAKDPELILQVATASAEARDEASGARWLLAAAALLTALGAEEHARRALEGAVARDPSAADVRAAALGLTDWRSDAALRGRVVDAALDLIERGAEEVALGLERALAHALIDHDLAAATAAAERASMGTDAPAAGLTLSLLRGASRGPDAPETAAALEALLAGTATTDPLRVGVELELARALGSGGGDREQAEAALGLVDGDRPELVAPRVLTLLDALQRGDRGPLAGGCGGSPRPPRARRRRPCARRRWRPCARGGAGPTRGRWPRPTRATPRR